MRIRDWSSDVCSSDLSLLDGHLGGRQDGGDALAAADALGGERELLTFALQQRGGLAGDACAGGAERVAERDGAAVEVGLVEIAAQLVGAGQRLGGEGRVQIGRASCRERVCPYV